VRRRKEQPDLLEELHAERSAERPDGRSERQRAAAARGPTDRFKPGSLPLLGLFVAVVIAAVYAEQGRPPYPPLEPSCTTGALALAPTEVGQREDVRYTLVGPDGDVLMALNTSAVSPALVATPVSPGAITQVFPARVMVGCRDRETFPAQVPVGRHTVTAFRLVDGAWVRLAETSLTVR
jgi:hypothetical protein